MLDRLQLASYGGAPFLARVYTTTGGRRTVVHNFVNSNNRFVEDLGPDLRSFTLSGWLADGADYIRQRDNLVSALERPGPQVLVHPTFGRVLVSQTAPYRIVEQLTELGAASVELQLTTDTRRVLPQQRAPSAAAVNAAAMAAEATIGNNAASVISVPANEPSILRRATDAVSSVTTPISDVIRSFRTTADRLQAFQSSVRALQSDVQSLVATPLNLVNTVQGSLRQMEGLFSSTSEQLAAYESLFGAGPEPVVFPATGSPTANDITAAAAAAASNDNEISRLVRATALTRSYSTFARIDFRTTAELDAVLMRLEDQFRAVSSDPTIPANAVVALEGLRDIAERAAADKRRSTSSTTVVSVARTSAQRLAYQLYGSADAVDALVNMNGRDVAAYRGNLEVLVR